MAENYIGLVNKPPIDEIYNISLVNKPDLENYDSELAHFGILGMKWGIRRYQNPDGTLTDAGKARLARQQARTEAVSKRKAIRQMKAAERRAKFEKKRRQKILNDPAKLAKHQNEFSTEELNKAKDRLWALNDINKLKNAKIQNAKRMADDILSFGETINNGIRFLNSPAGRGIRQSLGMSTDKLFDFNEKSDMDEQLEQWRKEAELAKYKMQKAQFTYKAEHPNEGNNQQGWNNKRKRRRHRH